jgi:hypothetical protein
MEADPGYGGTRRRGEAQPWDVLESVRLGQAGSEWERQASAWVQQVGTVGVAGVGVSRFMRGRRRFVQQVCMPRIGHDRSVLGCGRSPQTHLGMYCKCNGNYCVIS